MKDSFRLSMSWLHTWCGLICGWLLCAIFLAGSFSVFREPITHWMKAEPVLKISTDSVLTSAAESDAAAISKAIHYLKENAAGAQFWRIELPERADQALRIFWRNKGGAREVQQAAMDASSGVILQQPWGRKTEGGRHFMSFHYMLHGGIPGFWFVGFVAMGMLVALVSGVVVHKRIFKDFFTFRPGKGQRSWLDAHNVTAVLALPFLFMIVYTGLAFFYTSYMPTPARVVYGSDEKAYTRYQQELSPAPVLKRSFAGNPITIPDMAPLLNKAHSLTGMPARMLLIERPGDVSMTIKLFDKEPDTTGTGRILNKPGIVTFDGASGDVLQLQKPDPKDDSVSAKTHSVIEELHLVGFGGWPMKWFYFLSGLMGTVMIATGTILYSVKRRKKNEMEFGAATAHVYRWIEALNVAAVAGICVACIAYLYANRLIPADLAQRSTWEIRAFFIVWLLSLLHAALRPSARAWMEQLSLAALLSLALPLLNFITTGEQLFSYILRADWQGALVELTVMVLGVGLAYAAHKVRRSWLMHSTNKRTAQTLVKS